jgi:hypothetical protein
MPDGSELPFRRFRQAPNKVVTVHGGAGLEAVTGTDGVVTWETSLGSSRVASRSATVGTAAMADFWPALGTPGVTAELRVTGAEIYEGDSVFVVTAPAAGSEQRWMFAVASGFLAGYERSTISAERRTQLVAIHVSSYRNFDGLVIATRRAERTLGVQIVELIDEIIWGNVPDSVFAVPPGIRPSPTSPPAR